MGFLVAFLLPILATQGETWKARVPYLAAAALCVLGVYLSRSRNAWLGVIVGGLVLAAFLQPRLAKRGAVAFLLGLFVYCVLNFDRLAEQFVGDPNMMGRVKIGFTSLALFAQNPLFGVGFGMSNLREPFAALYGEIWDVAPYFNFHSHNVFIELLAGSGLLGFLAGTAWLVWPLWLLSRRRDLDAQPVYRGLVAGWAAFLVMGTGDSVFFAPRLVFVTFLVLAFTIVWLERAGPSEDGASPRPGGRDPRPEEAEIVGRG